MPKLKTPKHPEILLDIDGTCLDSAGKFNINLFEAIKAMGIKQVNFLTSFEMKNLTVNGEERSFRSIVIDQLKKMGVKVGYVVVNASPYLDFNEKGRGTLGKYYQGTMEKAERKIAKVRRKNPDLEGLSAREKAKLKPDQDKEKEILDIDEEVREEAARTRRDIDSVAAPDNPQERNKKNKSLVTYFRNLLAPKADELDGQRQGRNKKFSGGKELMLLHVLHHRQKTDNFVVFDDKPEVNNMVQTMDTDQEHYSDSNGRMHAVQVNMQDRNQSKDYYIRKLIQGYSIHQLHQFVLDHAKEFGDQKENLLDALQSVIENPEALVQAKQKGIYAQLVLACWHPHDHVNIVELGEKLNSEAENHSFEKVFKLYKSIVQSQIKDPAFKVKLLNSIIAMKLEGKKTPFLDNFFESEERKDFFTASANNQLLLAQNGKLNINDLIQFITLSQHAENLGIETPIPHSIIKSTIEAIAAHPQQYLELLRSYRELKDNTPEKKALQEFLEPEMMQAILRDMTSVDGAIYKKPFIGYPILKEMISGMKQERELLACLEEFENQYPQGNPEIASLFISLITGYSNIKFYPGDDLPQIVGPDTQKFQLNLLFELIAKKEPGVIDKVNQQFILNKPLSSCLLVIEEIKRSYHMTADDKRNLRRLLIDRIDSVFSQKETDELLQAAQYEKCLNRSTLDLFISENDIDRKLAILKHISLCSLCEISENMTQEEANELLEKLNQTLASIGPAEDDAYKYAKESALTAAGFIFNKLIKDQVPLNGQLRSQFETLLKSYLKTSNDCYSYLNKPFQHFDSNPKQSELAKIALLMVCNVLKESQSTLAPFLPTDEDITSNNKEKTDPDRMKAIALARDITNKSSNKLNDVITLAKHISALEKKEKPDTDLINELRKIQNTEFHRYVAGLKYNEQTKNEITKLKYFADNIEGNLQLNAVLDNAKIILNDPTRADTTKTEVLKALARTAQAYVEPAHIENKRELQHIAQKFKLTPSLNLLGKAILVLLSTLAAGVGLFVAGGIAAKQTYNDSNFFKSLYQKQFRPPEEGPKEDEGEQNKF